MGSWVSASTRRHRTSHQAALALVDRHDTATCNPPAGGLNVTPPWQLRPSNAAPTAFRSKAVAMAIAMAASSCCARCWPMQALGPAPKGICPHLSVTPGSSPLPGSAPPSSVGTPGCSPAESGCRGRRPRGGNADPGQTPPPRSRPDQPPAVSARPSTIPGRKPTSMPVLSSTITGIEVGIVVPAHRSGAAQALIAPLCVDL